MSKPYGAYARALRSCKAAQRKARSLAPLATTEALSPQLLDLGDMLNLPQGARRITSPETLRDLNPLMQERMQQVCYYLYVTTPWAQGIIDVIVDYVVGEGFQVLAEDPDVQKVVNKFWGDSINDLEANVEAWIRELLIFGELCLPVAVNPVNGFTRIGYIDPQQIDLVEFGKMETDFGSVLSIPVAVRLKALPAEREGKRLEIVRSDEDFDSETFGEMRGDCFYFANQKAKAATRGISELFNLADWVDVFDQMVFDFADKVRFLNAFIWHYIATGADKNKVEEIERDIRKRGFRQGGFWVTNEQVKIEAQTPEFHGAEMHESARMVKLYGIGGKRLPAWMFGDPVDANRAVAEVMEGPTGKMLTNKQKKAKRIVWALIRFILERAQAKGELPAGADLNFKLQVPDLSSKDMAKASTTLQGITNSIALAEDRGYVQSKTAARAVHVVLGQLGIDVDADEFEKAQEEKQQRDAEAIDALAPQQRLADALRRAKSQGGEPDAAGAEGRVQ